MTNERLAVSAADLDDLELPVLDAFLAARVPALLASGTRDEAGVRLGLLARVAPRIVPTMVGLYLFGKAPQYLFPEWGLSCVTFTEPGIDGPIARRQDLEGGLATLLEGGLSYVQSHSGTIQGSSAEYPELLVREALVNALVHRDLRKSSRVALRVFPDRIEIWSPGGPPDGAQDLEELARDGGISVPRNPLLAATARALGMGEQIGRGLLLVTRAAAAGGGGLPRARAELKASARDVLVTIPSSWQRPRVQEELS